MRMTEEQRAAHAEALGPAMIDLIARSVAGQGNEDDMLAIGVTAAVATAAAIIATRTADPAAIIALIHCTAEAAAQDICG